MVSTFYKGSDGCILAFDVTDLESFEALEMWRGDVLAKTIPMEQSYPIVVLGNKVDLADRQVSFNSLILQMLYDIYCVPTTQNSSGSPWHSQSIVQTVL